MKKQMICSVLIALLILALYVVVCHKSPLSSATANELIAVDGIGEARLEQIQTFIMAYPDAKVEDLRQLKGVDDMIIHQLKRKFR